MKMKFTFIFISAAVLLGGLSPASRGEVLLSQSAALERAFPGATIERRTLYLNKQQVDAVEHAARSRLPSAVVSLFEAHTGEQLTGRGLLDTHVVRTMPETVLVPLEPDGRLRAAMVLQFGEPPDYLPREGWLRSFEGKGLDEELWPGRGIHRVSGATLTVQALTEAVRRCLAIDALVVRGGKS